MYVVKVEKWKRDGRFSGEKTILSTILLHRRVCSMQVLSSLENEG